VGKKINDKFLKVYIELDKVCCEKFGITTGGVGEYINRLNNARFAPDRDEVLKRLVAYRDNHKRFYFEPKAVKKDSKLTNEDIKWIMAFKKSVKAKKDPVSVYLKKAKKYVSKKKFGKFLKVVLTLGIIGAVAGVIYALAPQLGLI
jgi:hypothetical protein